MPARRWARMAGLRTEAYRMEIATAGVLAMAHLDDGPADGWPVVLSHGFPYDVHAYDEVVPLLTARGARVVRPYLRGHGPTRFLSEATPRSGQQAALGSDLLALLDALDLAVELFQPAAGAAARR